MDIYISRNQSLSKSFREEFKDRLWIRKEYNIMKKEYKEIIDKNENISKDYLSSLIDILNDGENVIKYAWESEYSFYNKSNFIKTHNLSQNDIEYIISYLEKKYIQSVKL